MHRSTTPDRSSASAQAGFSLVELLVASLLTIISVAGTIAVFPQALRSTRQSGERTVLNHLGVQQLEYLKSLDLTHADLSNGTHPAQATDSQGRYYYPVPGFDEDYSLRWIVADGPTNALGNVEAKLRTVAVEATYLVRYDNSGDPIDEPGGVSVVLQTFLAER